jgi:hypothetical protein
MSGKALPGACSFDRMPVAQALFEPLRFLNANGALAQYSELVEVKGTSTS